MKLNALSLVKLFLVIGLLVLGFLLIQTQLNFSQASSQRETLELSQGRSMNVFAALRFLQIIVGFWFAIDLLSLLLIVKKRKIGWFLAWFFLVVNTLGTMRLGLSVVSAVILSYLVLLGIFLWKSYQEAFAQLKTT